jgi:hypothetical protein
MIPDDDPYVDQGAKIFQTLRKKILTLNPREVNITPTTEHPIIWAALMESAWPEVIVTLAALVDGTTSLYFSNGGGIIGSGNHPAVGKAAKRMIAAAELCLEYTEAVSECHIPQPECVCFHLLTFTGAYSAEIPESELQSEKHALSSIYAAGQELITQIRLVNENQQAA